MTEHSTEHVRRYQKAMEIERHRTARAMYDDLGKGRETFGTAGYWVGQFLRPVDNCDDSHTAAYRTMLKRAIVEREMCPQHMSLEIFADNQIKNCVFDKVYGIKTMLHAGFDLYGENFNVEHEKFGQNTGLNPKEINSVIKYFDNGAEILAPSGRRTLVEINRSLSGNETCALMAGARMTGAQKARETLDNLYVHCITDLFGENPAAPDDDEEHGNDDDTDPVAPWIRPTRGILTY